MNIQIKLRYSDKILFEFTCENNTIKKTVEEAVKKGAYLRCADLRGADLIGADLRGAYLSGADLNGYKIKKAIVITGIYNYIVIPFITETDEKRIVMGCFNRSLDEWETDFWNNDSEFPNNNSEESKLRLLAFETAKKWFLLQDNLK